MDRLSSVIIISRPQHKEGENILHSLLSLLSFYVRVSRRLWWSFAIRFNSWPFTRNGRHYVHFFTFISFILWIRHNHQSFEWDIFILWPSLIRRLTFDWLAMMWFWWWWVSELLKRKDFLMRISKSYTHGLMEVYFTNHRVLYNLSTIHHYLRNDLSNLPLYNIYNDWNKKRN